MLDESTLSRGKQRLPKGWRYPLSAKDIEGQLQDLKVPEELTLSFLQRPFGLRASEHLALLRAKGTVPVISASYFNVKSLIPSTALSRAPGRYERPRWSIYVYALPAAALQSCRETLLKFGLPTISRWLTTERPDTWYQGHREIQILFALASGMISVKEGS